MCKGAQARNGDFREKDAPLWLDLVRISFVVAAVFLATLFEAAWWAVNSLYLGAIETFEEAMYLSP